MFKCLKKMVFLVFSIFFWRFSVFGFYPELPDPSRELSLLAIELTKYLIAEVVRLKQFWMLEKNFEQFIAPYCDLGLVVGF